MKYGMNLLLWSGEVNDSLFPVIEQLKAIGFDGVELPLFNLDLDYAAIGRRPITRPLVTSPAVDARLMNGTGASTACARWPSTRGRSASSLASNA